MNVFEDLVLELKEENLLESTCVEPDSGIDTTDEPNVVEVIEEGDEGPAAEPELPDFVTIGEDTGDDAATSPLPRKVRHGREFFNKRAIAEVSSLQMVEHVLTGVEREYLKIVPKTFDDFNAKKALNNFLQITENSNSEEHKKAEFELMHETETWCSALAERDRNMPVSSLRHYCENSRPALSSQALLALGRFYRNSAYSESVRAKFDFVITRLFSRAGMDDTRSCLFDRDEMIGHITKLYADWSSVPLYSADSDESNLLLTALSFEELASEAETVPNFDQLITTDFFGRLRLFKESVSELFYAPNVTAAAIDCNIRIGNSYVKLIQTEQAKMDAASIEAKYGEFSEQTVSDAAGWTLNAGEIMRTRAYEPAIEGEEPSLNNDTGRTVSTPSAKEPKRSVQEGGSTFAAKLVSQFKAVNKWVLIVSAAMVMLCGGLGIWANYYAEEPVSTAGVRGFELESSPLNAYLKTAKVSGDTFYGILQPSWDVLPKEKRVEFLQKALAVAQQQKCRQVNLIGKDGKVAGYASATRTEVIMP